MDHSVLDQLAGHRRGGCLLAEVIDTFLRIAPCGSPPSRRRRARRTSPALERTAHSFLGSCANLGAKRMAEMCAGLETRGPGGAAEGAPELLEELQTEYALVKHALGASGP